jgi:hypothetical protein
MYIWQLCRKLGALCLGIENFDMCWYVDAEAELIECLIAIPVLTSFSSQPSTIIIQIVTSVACISSNLVVRVLSYSPSCTSSVVEALRIAGRWDTLLLAIEVGIHSPELKMV